jgi:histone H3/H4
MKKILQDLKKKPKKEDQREETDLVLPRSNF